MVRLFEEVLEAYGGLNRGNAFTEVKATIVSGGQLWGIKGWHRTIPRDIWSRTSPRVVFGSTVRRPGPTNELHTAADCHHQQCRVVPLLLTSKPPAGVCERDYE